jgi:hypothetical protein
VIFFEHPKISRESYCKGAEWPQYPDLLLQRGNVTDYSGRTFKNITAYEYAYWAMDTHMCRMLERHMDEATKTEILARCEVIERDGLTYKQDSLVKNEKHFNFKPLITAYTQYLEIYPTWIIPGNYDAVEAAWMAVGMAQRALPVHVMNEYCRPDRSFSPTPSFQVNGDDLPRSLRYINYILNGSLNIYPLTLSNFSNLGVNFALWRASQLNASGRIMPFDAVSIDLAAIRHLDAVRTADVKQSLEILGKINELEHDMEKCTSASR